MGDIGDIGGGDALVVGLFQLPKGIYRRVNR